MFFRFLNDKTVQIFFFDSHESIKKDVVKIEYKNDDMNVIRFSDKIFLSQFTKNSLKENYLIGYLNEKNL